MYIHNYVKDSLKALLIHNTENKGSSFHIQCTCTCKWIYKCIQTVHTVYVQFVHIYVYLHNVCKCVYIVHVCTVCY